MRPAYLVSALFFNFCHHKRLFADVRICKQAHTYFCAKFLKLRKLPRSMMGGNVVIPCLLGSEEIRSIFFSALNCILISQFCTMLSYDFRSVPNFSYRDTYSDHIFKDCRDLLSNSKAKNNSASHSQLKSQFGTYSFFLFGDLPRLI